MKIFTFIKLLSIVKLLTITGWLSISDISAHPSGEQEKPFQIKSYDWEGVLPANRVVYVTNRYGSIRSRSNSEEKVFMHATYQRIGTQALSPKFDINEVDGSLYIEIKYDESIKDVNGELRGRTDLSVLFPPTVKIIAETSSGMIKIDKTHSHVDAKTKTGKIKLTTTGLFSVQSDSGSIQLRLRGMHTIGNSSAKSLSGDISADIFNDMAISLKASTRGQIAFNGNTQASKQFSFVQGNKASNVTFNNQKGDIKINVIAPPALIKSVVPTSKKIDLREVPKSKPWKPGDPTKEINPKQINSKSKVNSKAKP